MAKLEFTPSDKSRARVLAASEKVLADRGMERKDWNQVTNALAGSAVLREVAKEVGVADAAIDKLEEAYFPTLYIIGNSSQNGQNLDKTEKAEKPEKVKDLLKVAKK